MADGGDWHGLWRHNPYLQKVVLPVAPCNLEAKMEDQCPYCGFAGYLKTWHACAETRQFMGPVRKIEWGERIEIVQPDDERQDPLGRPEEEPVMWLLQDRPSHRVWTSFLEGNLCACFHILRPDIPHGRQQMRRLLHTRLQALGDALMAEYDERAWEEDE